MLKSYPMLLLSVTVMITLFAVVILTSLLTGGRTKPAIGALFTSFDGSTCPIPCLFGVDWDTVATSDRAKLIMREHPLLKGLAEDYLSGGGQIIYGEKFLLEYWKSGAILYRTDWAFNGDNPTLQPFLRSTLETTSLQDVLNLWRNPAYIQLDSRIIIAGETILEMPLIYVYYPEQHMIYIHERAVDDVVGPNERLFAIMVFSSADMPDPHHQNYGFPRMLPDPWHGYGPISLYPRVDAPIPTEQP